MTHWDGLVSSNSAGKPQRICIMGATNRIQDIDEAILRRMPKKFPVPLPSAGQRAGIFKLILKDTKLDTDHLDLDFLIRVSAGLSGSDIKEACRDAAMVPMREYIKAKKADGTLRRGVNPNEVRGVRTEDFFGRKAEMPHSLPKSSASALATPATTAEPPLIAESVDGDDDHTRAWTDSDESEEEKAPEKEKAAVV
jgi:SpoVK/Ycf46/Vps4 family AAA+-type ATPase